LQVIAPGAQYKGLIQPLPGPCTLPAPSPSFFQSSHSPYRARNMSSMVTHKAFVVQSLGIGEIVTDHSIPSPRPDHMLVKVRAVALNPTDWKTPRLETVCRLCQWRRVCWRGGAVAGRECVETMESRRSSCSDRAWMCEMTMLRLHALHILP
jgi:hypothetical protein